MKTMPMETVSTGIPYTIAHVKIQKKKKNEDLQVIMSNLQPNCCLKVDFQKVDKHTWGKWLIHGTKRHKDKQLQSYSVKM